MYAPISKYHERPVNKWILSGSALVNCTLVLFAMVVFIVLMTKGASSVCIDINNLERTMQADSSAIYSNAGGGGNVSFAGMIASSLK